jgi:hypothetical protein
MPPVSEAMATMAPMINSPVEAVRYENTTTASKMPALAIKQKLRRDTLFEGGSVIEGISLTRIGPCNVPRLKAGSEIARFFQGQNFPKPGSLSLWP